VNTKAAEGGAMHIQGEGLTKKLYYKGETIFTEGEEASYAFIIESGSVEVFKTVEGEKIDLAILHNGALFGEMAIISECPRMASAYAIEDTILIKITHDMLEAKLKKYDKFTCGLIRVLINNLRNVHKSYIRRPRSVDDYLHVIDFHLGNLSKYMEKPETEEISAEAITHLDAINLTVSKLKTTFNNHKDKRKSVIEKSAVTSPHK